jgi:hypothetical protein
MSEPPPLPTKKRGFSGCGCVASILAFLVVLAGICVAVFVYIQTWTGQGKNVSTVPTDFVGVWQCTDGSEQGTIRIDANGLAQCDIHGRGYNYTIGAGKASFDRVKNKLSIKWFIFGPTWTVNEYPQTVDGQTQFIIDNHVFRRVARLQDDQSTLGI